MARSIRPRAPQPAFVLQRHDWSESSLIVELFTRGLGRVVTVARGAKKPTSGYRALLLPFQPVAVLLGAPPRTAAGADDGGGHDLLPLRSAEWAGEWLEGAPLVQGAALFSAFYLNELLLKGLARQDPHEALFDDYAAALVALAKGSGAGERGGGRGADRNADRSTDREEAAVLRAFELAMLRETGLLPDLSQATLTAEPLAEDGHYTLDATHGLVPAPDGATGARWTALEAAFAAGQAPGSARFAALHAACRGASAALRRPLQSLLHYHLGHTPMRTREVLRGVQKLGTP